MRQTKLLDKNKWPLVSNDLTLFTGCKSNGNGVHIIEDVSRLQRFNFHEVGIYTELRTIPGTKEIIFKSCLTIGKTFSWPQVKQLIASVRLYQFFMTSKCMTYYVQLVEAGASTVNKTISIWAEYAFKSNILGNGLFAVPICVTWTW